MNRTLGTPNEDDWPNVVFLPQFKMSFPKFKIQKSQLKQIVDNDELAYDLLQVRQLTLTVRQYLTVFCSSVC